jgi:hypothetical protein
VSAGEADPDILLVLDGAGETRLGEHLNLARMAKALGALSEQTKRRFFSNPFNQQGAFELDARCPF